MGWKDAGLHRLRMVNSHVFVSDIPELLKPLSLPECRPSRIRLPTHPSTETDRIAFFSHFELMNLRSCKREREFAFLS